MAVANPSEEMIADPNEENTIFTNSEWKEYFNVDLEYNNHSEPWKRETIIYFSIKYQSLPYDSNDSEESVLRKYLKNELEKGEEIKLTPNESFLCGKLKNSAASHAEVILFDRLRQGFVSFQEAKKKKDEKKTTNSKSNDLSAGMSKLHVTDGDQDMDLNNISIELIQNYSPCSKCAAVIVTFIDEFNSMWNIHISITFGTFYKIDSDRYKTENNLEGLKRLHEKGIQLNTAWERFRQNFTEIGTPERREAREGKDKNYMSMVKGN